MDEKNVEQILVAYGWKVIQACLDGDIAAGTMRLDLDIKLRKIMEPYVEAILKEK